MQGRVRRPSLRRAALRRAGLRGARRAARRHATGARSRRRALAQDSRSARPAVILSRLGVTRRWHAAAGPRGPPRHRAGANLLETQSLSGERRRSLPAHRDGRRRALQVLRHPWLQLSCDATLAALNQKPRTWCAPTAIMIVHRVLLHRAACMHPLHRVHAGPCSCPLSEISGNCP
jgi:hypothetical protein